MKGFTNPGDIVLDPFMGSGTVAAVAMELGRKFIGFEIDRNYCNVIVERLDNRKTMLATQLSLL